MPRNRAGKPYAECGYATGKRQPSARSIRQILQAHHHHGQKAGHDQQKLQYLANHRPGQSRQQHIHQHNRRGQQNAKSEDALMRPAIP